MRPINSRQRARMQRQIDNTFAEQVVFVTYEQEALSTWDGEPFDITTDEDKTRVERAVPCRIQHGTDGMNIRTYQGQVQVGEVGEVYVQISRDDKWIADAARNSEDGHMEIDGHPVQIREVTPNRVGMKTSVLVRGKYRSAINE